MPNFPKSNLEVKAWNFAKEKHKDQKRKFIGAPYFDAHVQKVNGIVKMYTSDESILAASLLHDVVEDCYEDKELGYKDIEEEFGKEVSDIVRELTSNDDDISIKFSGSKAQYLIHKMLGMSDKALLIKLGDRLQNISDAFTASESFRNKYYLETKEIIDAVRSGRKFNREQNLILREIEAKIGNIGSIFKMEKIVLKFDDFSKSNKVEK